MKSLVLYGSALFTVLTAVQPILAQSSETGVSTATIEENREPRLSDLGASINPQLGVSNFEYSGNEAGNSKSELSGGVTAELGGAERKLETGLLLMRTGTEQITTSYLTIPMLAKIRILQMKSQSWYAKVGAMSAFALSSSNDDATNKVDVLGSLGFGGRFAMMKKADFVIEASYNRGLLDALKTDGDTYNQGFLVMAGMSFGI
ncbi:MAG TPA: outer membrane beta-barrel protein [Bdellovibrionales bacterium]|nr:outer membrane beta-barrel protein [Bdellovibrionales bacterium]